MSRYRPANELLRELGISEPQDIDIYAIAHYCGATVLEQELKGCEARIVGLGDSALITVNSLASPNRRRFSAAHELAHWLRSDGKVQFKCEPESSFWKAEDTEAAANRYAADLLMPPSFFRPRVAGKPVTFASVSELANLFTTSLSATAIRVVDLCSLPAMLVCSDRNRAIWSRKSSEVPRVYTTGPGRGTFAHGIHRGVTTSGTGDVNARAWFDRVPYDYYLHEDSRRITPDLVLSLLWWTDEEPLIQMQEQDEARDYRRSDWRDE